MSDRVMFVGFDRLLFLDGNISQGFPFLIQDVATVGGHGIGDGTSHPVLLPMEVRNTAVPSHAREYYRGKTLAVSTDLAYVDVFGTPYTFPNGALPIITDRTTELDTLTIIGRNWRDTSAGFDVQVRLGTTFPILSDGPPVLPTVDLWLDLLVQCTSSLGFTSIQPGAWDGVALGTIDGSDPFSIYWGLGTNLSVTFSYFDLYWTDFWPYAAKDATPIYDTLTGLELQDVNA